MARSQINSEHTISYLQNLPQRTSVMEGVVRVSLLASGQMKDKINSVFSGEAEVVSVTAAQCFFYDAYISRVDLRFSVGKILRPHQEIEKYYVFPENAHSTELWFPNDGYHELGMVAIAIIPIVLSDSGQKYSCTATSYLKVARTIGSVGIGGTLLRKSLTIMPVLKELVPVAYDQIESISHQVIDESVSERGPGWTAYVMDSLGYVSDGVTAKGGKTYTVIE